MHVWEQILAPASGLQVSCIPPGVSCAPMCGNMHARCFCRCLGESAASALLPIIPVGCERPFAEEIGGARADS